MSNHGLYWSVGEMRQLMSDYEYGGIAYAAGKARRTVTACQVRVRMMRTAQMLNQGAPDDTLRTWRKKNA